MKFDPESRSLQERQRQLRAASGPGNTFHCAQCRARKGISGRRKIGGRWLCTACVAATLEAT